MSTRDDYIALWRASAFEAVPYTDDYPEALLILPEILDGAVGQGGATCIKVKINLNPDTGRGLITIEDNGGGMKNVTRFLRWAAVKNSDNMHRNGHGMKKCMTKWEKDYDKAKWWVLYRKPNRDLIRIDAPFIGIDTKQTDVHGDEETLMPSGTQWGMEFDMSILGPEYNTAISLAGALKEIIETRYDEAIIQRVEFIIEVQQPKQSIRMNSRLENWHNFHWYVKKEVTENRAELKRDKVVEIPGGRWYYKAYRLTVDGRLPTSLKQVFPTYGGKNMKCARVHISVGCRMIEAILVAKLHGGENHNRFNGYLEFVDFMPDSPEDFEKMPVPCTTKVSFYENGEVFREFKAEYLRIQNMQDTPAGVVTPAPAVVVAPAAAVAPVPVVPPAPASTHIVTPVVAPAAAPAATTLPTRPTAGLVIRRAPPAPPAPAPAPPAWQAGVTINLDTNGRLIIHYGSTLKHQIAAATASDRDSLHRRVLRCENFTDAKKVITAWVKLMG